MTTADSGPEPDASDPVEPTAPSAPSPSASPVDSANDAPAEPVVPEAAPPVASRFDAALSWVRGLPYLPALLVAWLASCPTIAILPKVLKDVAKFPLSNELPTRSRQIGTGAVVATAVVGLGVALLLHRRHAAKEPITLDASLRKYATRLAPFALLPVLSLLLSRGVEAAAPLFTIALCATVSGGLAFLAYRFSDKISAIVAKIPTWVPPLLALVAGVSYAILAGRLSVIRVEILSARNHDLGIYDSLFWHAANGLGLYSDLVKGGLHSAAHFDPIIYALAQFYKLRPNVYTVLLIQTLFLASGVIPVYLLGSRVAKSPWVGAALAWIWCLQPATHGAHLFDFHSVTLAAPVLVWLFLLLQLEKYIAYACVLVLLLVIREDLSLVACCLGVYAWLTGRRRVAAGTIVTALVYLVLVKRFAMPDSSLLMKDSNNAYGYGYYFRDLLPFDSEGVRGIVMSIVTNPVFALKHALTEPKVVLLAQVFLPLAALPFLSGRTLVVFGYGLSFLLLGSKPAVYGISFHYTVFVFPFAFGCTALVLSRLGEISIVQRLSLDPAKLRVALMSWMFVCSILLGVKFGALAPNDTFKPGGHPFAFKVDENQRAKLKWIRNAAKIIGPDAKVSSSEHLGPHVSNRDHLYNFPWGSSDYDFLIVDNNELDTKQKSIIDAAVNAKQLEKVSDFENLVLWRKRRD